MESVSENLVRNGKHLAHTGQNGFYWFDNSIDTQALLLTAMNEIAPQNPDGDALRNWLITQKRTQAWPSSKGTVMSVYSILSRKDALKPATDEVKIAGTTIQTTAAEPSISLTWENKEVKKNAAKAQIVKSVNAPSFGGWHYFFFQKGTEVKASANSQISMNRQLYVVRNTASGETLEPLSNQQVRRGDKIRVRLAVNVKNTMEYVHIHDQRAAGFEPAESRSGYRYSRGVGYYTAIHDASVDIFIDHLPKGDHVIEYELVASQIGQMNNGYASVECFYAPEMKAHTEGVTLKVGNREANKHNC